MNMTNLNPVTRSTSVAEWFERQEQNRASFEESLRNGLAYQPQSTDVFISPYAKCGTTWLQQIVHGLKTRGDMDFDDISRVVPWLEWAYELGLDIYTPQKGAFRAFKSHVGWHDIPKGGRYLISVRDPKDALVSFYRFFDGFEFEAGSVSIEEFAREFFMAEPLGRYWDHLASWWEIRHDQNVLLLCFEEMKMDLPGTVQATARFVGIELDEALLEIVVRQSSFDFMLAHKDKFDDLLMREYFVRTGMHPPGGDAAKVRSGRVGDHRQELPADISAELDAIWSDEIEVKFGLPSYQALRETLIEESAKTG